MLLTLSDPSWYLIPRPSLAAANLLVAVLVALGRYTRTRPAERSGKTGSPRFPRPAWPDVLGLASSAVCAGVGAVPVVAGRRSMARSLKLPVTFHLQMAVLAALVRNARAGTAEQLRETRSLCLPSSRPAHVRCRAASTLGAGVRTKLPSLGPSDRWRYSDRWWTSGWWRPTDKGWTAEVDCAFPLCSRTGSSPALVPAVPALARSSGLAVGEEVLCFLREAADVFARPAISCYFGARCAQGAAFPGLLDCYLAFDARAVKEIAL